MTEIRSAPCSSCPYRQDVPSGLWSAEDYAKLPLYDAPTADQPARGFGCHATPEHFCHGWAVVHTSRGHAFDLLALRFAQVDEIPEPVVPLFDSGADAAAHGLADVDDPSPEAYDVMARLLRKYGRLQGRRF